MTPVVKLSLTATSGIVPFGLALLIASSARSFHGVARFKTVHEASVVFNTVHEDSADFRTVEENTAVFNV